MWQRFVMKQAVFTAKVYQVRWEAESNKINRLALSCSEV